MSRIDRRAFLMGCLSLPLAGCPDQKSATFVPALRSDYTKFLNCGSWSSNTIFVVNGGIKPGGGIAC
jgi:hypothetical protein